MAIRGDTTLSVPVLIGGVPFRAARVRLESLDPSIAVVDSAGRITALRRDSTRIRVTLLSGATGAVPPETTFVVRGVIDSMTVPQPVASLFALGDIVRFAPGYLDGTGAPLSAAEAAAITPTFALALPSSGAVTIDAAGNIKAKANGVDAVCASVDTSSICLMVHVRQRAARVSVTPESFHFRSLTETGQFVATALDGNDSVIAQPAVTWTSDNGGVVAVGTSGMGTALANGTARVTATVDSAVGSTTVTVAQIPARLGFPVQPSGAAAGGALAPVLQVAIQDSLGNTVTDAAALVTVSLAANPGGGTLAGTRSRTAEYGVATFSDLSLDKVGSGYTLTATANGLVATSAGFDITAGSPSRLAFATQPAGATAGAPVAAGTALTPAVQVAIQDEFGNLVTTATSVVTVALENNPGGGTLSGTRQRAAVGGIATFPDLSVDKAGAGYTLAAAASGLSGASAGLTGATSAGFDVTAAGATKLVFLGQPTTAPAGAGISPAVRVAVQDAFGNTVIGSTVPVTIAVGTNAGGATPTGTLTQSAVAGVATFSDLSLDRAASGYTLTAAASGLTGATSAAFAITPGAATRLAFIGQPTSIPTGVTTAVQVAVQDAFGNTVTGSTVPVTIAVGTNAGGATLTGTLTQNAVAGVATFSDLSLDKAGSGYTLTATASGLAGATSAPLSVTPGATSRLAFLVQPRTAHAGTALSPAVEVAVQDEFGNLVTTATPVVTLAFQNNAGGGTLSGTLQRTAVGGIATFPDLSIDKAASGYSLAATADGLAGAASASFTIQPGAATRIAFTRQPTSAVAGSAIAPAVELAVQDAHGNTVTTATHAVTVTLAAHPAGGTLAGTIMSAAVSGVARFADLSVNRAGSGYRLAATAEGLTGAASTAFNVMPGPAAALAFSAQPSQTVVGTPIQPPPVVTVQDALGNIVTTGTHLVTVALGANSAGGTLTGTLTRSVTFGMATFPDLSLDKAGTGYTLVARAAGLTDAGSAGFDVTAGAAVRLVFLTEPAAVQAGGTVSPAVRVAVQDALGNTVTSFAGDVTIAITTGTGAAGATLSGTKVLPAVSGMASFADLSVDKAGAGYTLTVASGTLEAAASAAFAVAPGPATKLVFTGEPSTTQAGAAVAPAVRVAVHDAFGNIVTAGAASVTVGLATNPGGSTLSGTLTQPTAAGVATFSDLWLDKTGSGYTLAATASGLAGASSAAFGIIPGGAAKVAFVSQPSTAEAGQALTPAVQVAVQDAFGNIRTGATRTITLAIAAGTGTAGATLDGTTSLDPVNGVATFSGLSIARAGTDYALVATASGLVEATSVPFNITPGVATRLAFTGQPSTIQAGAIMSPALRVAVEDAFGNTVTGDVRPVTLRLTGGPELDDDDDPPVLSGTVTRSAVAGVATFGNLSVDLVGSGYALTALASGVVGATSATFAVRTGTPSRLAFTVQPATTAAGSLMTPAVRVTAQDGFGNTLTTFAGPVTLGITSGTGTPNATLSGTRTVAAVNGSALFGDLSFDKVGSGYTLTAVASGLAGATSTPFGVVSGAPARLAFAVQPSGAQAGATVQPAVRVVAQDALGNVATGYSGNITVGLTGGTGTSGATLGGTLTVAAVSGVALFSSLNVDKAGTGYSLTATAPALPGATSAAFAITGGPAARLAFTVQPATTATGSTLQPAVRVAAQDAFGNTDATFTGSVALAITPGTGASGAILSGTTAVAAAAGVATFGTLNIDRVGAGYTLTATTGGLAAAASATFNVTAKNLVFVVQPANAQAGSAIAPAVQVAVQGGFGITDTTFTGSVTLAIATGTGAAGAALSGQTTVTAVRGVATFSDLRLEKAGPGYALTASGAGLVGATSAPFTVAPAAAARLAFAVHPTPAATDEVIAPAVRIVALDAFGNGAAEFTGPITLAITPGTGTGGAVLNGTRTVAAAAGVATFADLNIARVGTGYALSAMSGSLVGATSAAFDIYPGAPARLGFLIQPTAAVAGTAMAPAVQVAIQDAFGNTVPSASGAITLAIGTNPAGGTLAGAVSKIAVNGVATFGGLSLDKAGTGYTFTATGGGLAGATSVGFTVSAGAATRVVFTVQPRTTPKNMLLSPAVQATALDAFGNTATGFSGSVTIAITPGTGGTNATLSGTRTVTAVSGVAGFSDLSIDHVGTGYRLTTTAQGLTSAASTAFDITSATRLVITVEPTSTALNATITPAVEVTVVDNFGNVVTNSAVSVTMDITAGTGTSGAKLNGTVTVTTLGGVARFTDLSINRVGTGYRLTAGGTLLTSPTTAAFDIR